MLNFNFDLIYLIPFWMKMRKGLTLKEKKMIFVIAQNTLKACLVVCILETYYVNFD